MIALFCQPVATQLTSPLMTLDVIKLQDTGPVPTVAAMPACPLSTLWKGLLNRRRPLRSHRQRLASTFKRLEPIRDAIASEVTPQQIEGALKGFPPAHRNAALRYLRAAFNFGIRSGLLRENPVKRLEFTRIIRDQVEVIPPVTVEKLLIHALTLILNCCRF
jgi:hypothetical protein